jgi:hypothetical protein
MFKIYSDLSMVLRKELDVAVTGAGQVLSSGVTGSWVTLDSSGNAILTSTQTALAWPIWNESYRSGALGQFTPDVVNSKKVSVIVGKIFATTDQFTGSPSRGDILYTTAGGKLTNGTIGTNHPVAVCVKASYSTVYFTQTLDVIDIQTL